MKRKNELCYRILTPLMRLIFKLYYHPLIINKEYIPKKGPIIIVGNHKHVFDQCLTIIATKRPLHYMAKKEYFDSKLGFFFKMVGCISVNRTIKDEQATKEALNILNNQGALGLFPEGTRNKTKDKLLLPLKYGAVSLAKKTNATIIPFGLTGDYKFRSKNLLITYGKPFKVDNLSLEKAQEILTTKIEELIKYNLKLTNRTLKEELESRIIQK